MQIIVTFVTDANVKVVQEMHFYQESVRFPNGQDIYSLVCKTFTPPSGQMMSVVENFQLVPIKLESSVYRRLAHAEPYGSLIGVPVNPRVGDTFQVLYKTGTYKVTVVKIDEKPDAQNNSKPVQRNPQPYPFDPAGIQQRGIDSMNEMIGN